ncbi:MAG: ComEA family DNA-binding protein [Chloroflexota bacterium]
MDPTSSPWRVFEAPDSPNGQANQAGPSGQANQAGPSGQAGPSASTSSTAPSVPRGPVLAIVVATVLLVVGAVWFAGSGTAAADVTVESSRALPSDGAGADQLLVIDVAGAVVDPGVYRLPPGSRVGDAIAIAGGYGPRVDARRVAVELNLAAPLSDGQHLSVPSRDDVAPIGGAIDPPAGGTTGGLLDLNRATAAELDALPGIGPVTAAKIIAARDSSPFTAVQDLRDRKLVGQKVFDGLRDLVTVP